MLSKSFTSTSLVALIAIAVALPCVGVQAETADSVEFFENKIRPVLAEHCYSCHASDSEEIGGSLTLDSRSGMMTGGDSGPAIQPGESDASVLISAIKYESSEMPPEGRLPDHVISDFEKWIDAGAIDPRNGESKPADHASEIDIEAGRRFWAFRPLEVNPPNQKNRSRSRGTIDDYLFDALEGANSEDATLCVNAPASPAARLRRLSFDLTGLPPDQDLLARWIADPTPVHWQENHRSVFGDRWDSESIGRDTGWTWLGTPTATVAILMRPYHDAWRYRDYLIRSFASDQPLDKMIHQQIAGDLLPFSERE